MFNQDFYPTPEAVITEMLHGFDVSGKIILEPSAGKGDIVDYVKALGAAEVIACETEMNLRSILANKCKLIGTDFLKVESHEISHVDYIIMNPPFSRDEQHITHAWNIAPAGCQIVALCNLQTYKNAYSNKRAELKILVDEYGSFKNLKDCFTEAERRTGVEIGLIRMLKPGSNYNTEFDGFFTDEDEPELQANAIMSYNFVRDLVNRYVEAVKLYDRQLEIGVQMNMLTSGFYSSKLGFSVTEDEKPKSRNEFKKDLQKSGWEFIFRKMNMQKYATKGLREDINKFVETQHQYPFTMKNIYKMLELVIGTTESRMDKAILEVFDKLTHHYHENRYAVEGWKTNSHYLINQKFIMPWVCNADKWHTGNKISLGYGSNLEDIEDMVKAICFITGTNFDECTTLRQFVSKNECEYGQLYSWGFFEIRGFKKGTMHFTFNSQDLWAQFNQRVAKIKGYPLYENVPSIPA